MQLGLILASKDLPGHNYWKPLGLGYLKSYIKTVMPDIDVVIYDGLDLLINGKPNCVGISTSTENFSVAQEYIKRLQHELKAPILLGGVHISVIPETLPHGVIGCLGEGEETIVELIRIILASGTLAPNNLSKVKGITYYDADNQLVQTEPRPLIRPLDKIPLPDRDALGIKPGANETLYMFTSRGCPYKCKFCVSKKHWRAYREFSSDYVIREMELLVEKYKVKQIHFFDDLFIVNKKRLGEIADSFAKRKFNVTTSCAVRANLVDDELCESLKRINITEVVFGAESFSERILKELKSNSVTVQQNQRALDILYAHGIKADLSMIFGSPEEKREDLLVSWKSIFNNLLAKKINKIGWGFLRPYPGCEYWDMALRRGIVSVDMDWSLFASWSNSIFYMNDHLTRDEIENVIDEWRTKCYLVNLNFIDAANPKYSSKSTVFIKNENLIKDICKREIKDESDLFVAQEYNKFLGLIKDNKITLFVDNSEGWEPPTENVRWTRKGASFYLASSVNRHDNLLTMLFYLPDIKNYKNSKLSVTLKIDKTQEYNKLLGLIKDSKITLFVDNSEGWGPPAENVRRIIKEDSFYLSSSVNKHDNLLTMLFYLPDIKNYKNSKLSVTLKIDKTQEYNNFLDLIKDSKITLFVDNSEGWDPPTENVRWIRKEAGFYLPSSVNRHANLLTMLFYVPDIKNYKNSKLSVTLKIDKLTKQMEVFKEGVYALSIPISFLPAGDFIKGQIICSDDFCPAKGSNSNDTRNLSIIVTGFRLANDNEENAVGAVDISDSQP